MPRGNDSETALHELADEFGQGVGNAEAMIDANAGRRTAQLATVSGLAVKDKQTSELDLDSLEGPNGERVVDAAVRGSGATEGTIVVYEDDSGRLLKHLAESSYDDKEESGPRRPSRAAKVKGEQPKDEDGKVAS